MVFLYSSQCQHWVGQYWRLSADYNNRITYNALCFVQHSDRHCFQNPVIFRKPLRYRLGTAVQGCKDPGLHIRACQECKQQSFSKPTSIFCCLFMYTYGIFTQIMNSKKFSCQEIDLKTRPTHWKVKISCQPNIGMWGVYPEAMACNVGGMCSDLNLIERILR